MVHHYLLTLYRSLIRDVLYAVLNILGLAVGIAVFLVLFLDVRFENGFDRWIPQAENTYRLDAFVRGSGQAVRHEAGVSSVIAPLMQIDYPQIIATTQVLPEDVPTRVGDQYNTEQAALVDPDFFRVLDLPLASGNAGSALNRTNGVIISENLARKYFKTTSALGRLVTLTIDSVPSVYRVTGVLRDIPPNSHLVLDMLIPLTPAFRAAHDTFRRWTSVEGSTYLRFGNAADAATVQGDLAHFVARRGAGGRETTLGRNASKMLQLQMDALPTLHFKDADIGGSFKPGVDARVVASLAVVGVLTLLIAVLNYINLSTARASLRAREVAVRKVLGATRWMLLVQFLVEAIAVSFLAVLLGAALTELALPLVNATGGTSLTSHYFGTGSVVTGLLLLALIVGIGAGIYPAVLLSRFPPAQVLATTRLPGGGQLAARVRAALVVIQFTTAVAFTICTLVMSAQSKFMRDADRGFQRDGLILVDSLTSPSLNIRQGAIVDALRSTAGVSSVALSDREPAAPNEAIHSVSRPGLEGEKTDLLQETIGPNYFDAYGAKISAGRPFDAAHGLDDLKGEAAVKGAHGGKSTMINEAALKPLGFASASAALGQTLRVGGAEPNTIIGVVANIRFMSARRPIAPMYYLYDSHLVDQGVAAIRYQGIDPATMMDRLAATWRKTAPEVPFAAKTADAKLSNYYIPDEQRARIFTYGAVLAVAIGCLGLYGLASFNTARRVREIGIRKTLGASTSDILRLLIGQFVRPVLIANLIAWPLAFFAMRSWLASFDQKILLSPFYFLAASLLTLAIALGTVAGQAYAVARAEPAKAMRHE